RRSRRASRSRAGGGGVLGSRGGTLVLPPPPVRGRLAANGHHARARGPAHPAQRRVGVEVYADASAGAAGVVRTLAGSRDRVAARSRDQAAAALGEARAAALPDARGEQGRRRGGVRPRRSTERCAKSASHDYRPGPTQYPEDTGLTPPRRLPGSQHTAPARRASLGRGTQSERELRHAPSSGATEIEGRPGFPGRYERWPGESEGGVAPLA